MSEAERQPPPFYCPLCGQKHRADLTPLEKRPGASVSTRCRRCESSSSSASRTASPSPRPHQSPQRSSRAEQPEPQPAAKPAKRARAARTPRRSRGGGPPPETAASGRTAAQAAEAEHVTTPPPLLTAPAHIPYDAALSDKPLEDGEEVGRYAVKGLARKGLTSTVYRAHDPTTKRSVGLKVLGADAPAEVRERFLRQVDVQAKIRHPSILPVYDRGELADGRPFMAMELLHHPLTLADVLERRADGTLADQRKLAPLAELETLVDSVLVPVADGIYVANIETGVVHGDLRPENILIDGHTLRPYVVDFGRASAVRNEDAGEVVAMPSTHYLSPEQARGEVHGRTDVWGLGALLHALITGKPPLEGSGDDLRRAAADAHYAALPGTAPPALRAIVQKAMAREPSQRYVNARQLTADLKAWRHGHRVRAADEFGGPGISVEEKKRARRVQLRTVGWIAAGLLVGLLVGSRIRIGGDDPDETRIRGIEQLVERFHQDVSELGEQLQSAPADLGYTPFVAAVAPEDAYGIWQHLDRRADALLRRLAVAAPSALRSSLEARIEYDRGRLTPPPIVIDAPADTPVAAVNVSTGDRVPLAVGPAHIPPGRWNVALGQGDRARVPVCIPLSVRPQGVEAEAVEPRARWSIPVAPSSLPSSRVLVVGVPVTARTLPFGPAGEPTDVTTFAVDRGPVTNAQYASFLASIPEGERAGRVPRQGLELSRARVWRPASGMGRLPVQGVCPDDARAYCAWASAEEGLTLRLPTEAEWLLASGAVCSRWARGDLATESAAPYGVAPMPEGLSEMVEATPPASGTIRKEPGSWYAASALAGDAPADAVGFRCVQELP